jgi:hypothetical protein
VGRGTAPQAEGLAVAKKRGEARFRFVYETGGPWLPRMYMDSASCSRGRTRAA